MSEKNFEEAANWWINKLMTPVDETHEYEVFKCIKGYEVLAPFMSKARNREQSKYIRDKSILNLFKDKFIEYLKQKLLKEGKMQTTLSTGLFGAEGNLKAFSGKAGIRPTMFPWYTKMTVTKNDFKITVGHQKKVYTQQKHSVW